MSLPRRSPWQLNLTRHSSSSSSSTPGSSKLPPSLSGSGKSSSVSHQRLEFKPTGFRVPRGQEQVMANVGSKGDKATSKFKLIITIF